MKKHPVLLLHSITNGKQINNSSGARATGWELLCLLQPPFKCNNVALQSHLSALPHSSKPDQGTEQHGWMCDTHHSWGLVNPGNMEMLKTAGCGTGCAPAVPVDGPSFQKGDKDYTGVEKRHGENLY